MVKGLDQGQRAALLISEMQNGIANPAYVTSPLTQQVEERRIVARINALAERFRAGGLPVIHSTVTPRAGYLGWPVNSLLAARIKKEGRLVAGTASGAVHDEIPVAESDIVSDRHHGVASFTGTDLATTLRALGVETVVLCGVSTNIALMGCSIEAVGLGFTAVVAEDCAAGGTAESHRMQIALHFPLVATVASAEQITAALAI